MLILVTGGVESGRCGFLCGAWFCNIVGSTTRTLFCAMTGANLCYATAGNSVARV